MLNMCNSKEIPFQIKKEYLLKQAKRTLKAIAEQGTLQ